MVSQEGPSLHRDLRAALFARGQEGGPVLLGEASQVVSAGPRDGFGVARQVAGGERFEKGDNGASPIGDGV